MFAQTKAFRILCRLFCASYSDVKTRSRCRVKAYKPFSVPLQVQATVFYFRVHLCGKLQCNNLLKHMNKAETFWRKATYEWLKPSDYASFGRYKRKIKQIFNRIGLKYKVNFKELKIKSFLCGCLSAAIAIKKISVI